ncbi:MAG: SPOR domain-containing protein, partial [Muribaculaceae bacterium]|nr:SPOR domain-containing protein [Muribaculaceae bacterium]
VNNKPGKQKPLGTAYGYRVQVYANSNAGTAKETAKTRAREIARKFPNYKAYISFSTPSWRLRIGDFKDQDDAKEALVKLKRSFPSYAASMMVVRDHINIWSHD